MKRVLALVLCLGASARAGGGPERTLLVVNENSPLSLTVANAYRALRGIPDSHVVYLKTVPGYSYPGHATMTLEQCREQILVPVLDAIDARDLVNEVDVITYSVGFPYIVYCVDFAREHGLEPSREGHASLTGLTCFAFQVLAGGAGWANRAANRYFRGGLPSEGVALQPMTAEEAALSAASDAAYREKNYSASLQACQKLVATYRDDGGVWYDKACIEALLGMRDAALDSLEKAVAAGWSHAFHARNDADLESLRTADRFKELLAVMEEREPVLLPSHGYRAAALWDGTGAPESVSLWIAADKPNGGYFLSTVLGYTGVRGNTLPEVLDCLARSAQVDGTHPEGTVYLLESDDVRSRARQPMFGRAVEELKRRGRAARIVPVASGESPAGDLPLRCEDVLGAALGTASFDWGKSGSSMVPGALVENSTSLGCGFWTPGETKVSELVRHGVLGTSGAVNTAALPNFPTPFLHAYYADGCSLAESFYQAISAPFPLLVLGDPLVRPFARFATVELGDLDLSKALQGSVTLRPVVTAAEGRPLRSVELWMDGWLLAEGKPGDPLSLDTTAFEDGLHEIVVVAEEADPVGTRSLARGPVRIENSTQKVALQGVRSVEWGKKVTLRGSASGSATLELFEGERLLAAVEPRGAGFQVDLDSSRLGLGRNVLRVVGTFPEGSRVRSDPLELEVRAPRPARGHEAEEWFALAGLTGVAESPSGPRKSFAVTSLEPGCAWPLYEAWQDVGGEAGTRLALRGEFRIDREGFYEVQVYSTQAAQVFFDGAEVVSTAGDAPAAGFGGAALGKGWHSVEVEITTRAPQLQFHVFLSGADEGRFLGGERLCAPREDERAAETEEMRLLGVYADRSLRDGDAAGSGQLLPSGELEFVWKRYQQRLSGVVLSLAQPEAAKGGAGTPLEWVVERRSSAGWEKVPNLEQVLGWDSGRGSRKEAAPAWVWLRFSSTSTRELRVRPVQWTEGSRVLCTEAVVLTRAR